VIYAFLAAGLLLFTLSLHWVGVVPRARLAIAEGRNAMQLLSSDQHDERTKETLVQQSALRMLSAFASITLRSVLALAVPTALLLLGELLGLYTRAALIDVASDWRFITVSCIAMILLWLALPVVMARARPAASESSASYSGTDRALHRLALQNPELQKGLADVENRIFASRLAPAEIVRPVFVTALPRAGTTLLLEVLSGSPELATATYRDMPFVLCPLLWEWVSGALRRPQALRERAHGDGMLVGYDSPEAFEEVAWKCWWPGHYRDDRIEPWNAADRDPEFDAFLRAYMRKIVVRAERPGARYLSKNNANIARLELLAQLFPDCRIVIPVRDPFTHAASLARQHARFLEIHARDRFALQYMEWLGHYEFGGAFRPIAFDDWLSRTNSLPDPAKAEFWVHYWLAAYSAIARLRLPNTLLVDYWALCSDPSVQLATLAEALVLADTEALVAQAGRFQLAERVSPEALRESSVGRAAQALYEELTARALGADVVRAADVGRVEKGE
jgi:hypothetical protein